MQIGGFLKTSLVDFPGCISAVIFTQGCNFNCPFCYNSDLIPVAAPDGLEWKDIFTYLKKMVGKIDAVVFSGGEPLLQQDIASKINSLKILGYKIKLDTNGTSPVRLQSLLDSNLLDYIAMDIKSDEANYHQAAGRPVDIVAINASISLIKTSSIPYEFRTTVVPGIHTELIVKKMKPFLTGANKYFIQNFSNIMPNKPELGDISPFTEAEMTAFKVIGDSICRECFTR